MQTEFMALQKMKRVKEKPLNRMIHGKPEPFTQNGISLQTPSSHDSQMKMFVYPDYALKQFLIENQNIENLIPDAKQRKLTKR